MPREVDDETSVTPANLKRTLTNPSISSAKGAAGTTGSQPGYRAAEAVVRPSPVYVAGDLGEYGFDLRRCEFSLKVVGWEPAAATGASDDNGVSGLNKQPTTVFLPEFHFPRDRCEVTVSSGKWEIGYGLGSGAVGSDEDEGEGGSGAGAPAETDALVQTLRWYHGPGEQTLMVKGVIRRADMGLVGANEAGDETYLQQCQQGTATNCSLM